MKEAILGIILGAHKVWLKSGGEEGFRADLRFADLRFANLNYADLSYADLQYVDLSYADLQYVDLSYADLQYADLHKSNLRYIANGNDREILTLQSGEWQTVITKNVIAIGCQQHSVTEWFGFSDSEIDDMDENALQWWTENKEVIKQVWQNNFEQKT